MTEQQHLAWLGKNTLTAKLAPEEQLKLAEVCELRVYDKGDAVYRSTDHADSLYMVHSGQLYFERLTSDGNRAILNLVFAGDIVGFSGSSTYQGSLVCATPVIASQIDSQVYRQYINEIPSLEKAVRSQLFQHMTDQQNHIYMLGHQNAEKKICYFLELLLRRQPANTPMIYLNLSRTEMADFLGLRKETIIRGFHSLVDKGWIEMPESNEVILNKEVWGKLAML